MVLNRNKLYDLVWSKPLTKLAKEYTISDNGLRKICKKHNIPLPKSGHWQKIQYGKKVNITPLPKAENDAQIELKIRKEGDENVYNDISELYKFKRDIKNDKKLKLNVPAKLTKPHKYIVATKKYQEQLKIKNKKRDWSIRLDKTDVLSINVSDKLYSRSLRIIDTLIKIFEKRGYKLNISGKTEVIINNQTYSIRLAEKNKRVKKETNLSWDSFDLVPTGNLVLRVDHLYPIKEWCDGKTRKLEDKLIDILAWLELKAKQDEEQQIASELWNKKYQEQKQREIDLQNQKDEELGNFEKLFQSATRYHKTTYIRDYIDKFESYAIETNTLDYEKKQWIRWARAKADWYDPFIEKEDKLLGSFKEEYSMKNKPKYNW